VTAPAPSLRKLYEARLVRAFPLVPDATTKHFEFELPGGDRFAFRAGQFISMHLPAAAGRAGNGSDDVRAYSIASAPRPAGFDLCLNRVAGGRFSNYLCDLPPGGSIRFEGPFGFFTLPERLHRDLVFVATGTGIAPVRGLLQELFAPGRVTDREVWLIFGVRYPETILYRGEFEQLAAGHVNFHFWPTLSRAPESWTGCRGHVQPHVEALCRDRVGQLDIYICGLKLMVDDVRARLKAFGFDRKQIHYEKYD